MAHIQLKRKSPKCPKHFYRRNLLIKEWRLVRYRKSRNLREDLILALIVWLTIHPAWNFFCFVIKFKKTANLTSR